MELKYQELDSKNITVKYGFVSSVSKLDENDILVIRFEGSYPDGCSGNADAQFMYAMGMAGVYNFSPSVVILDLRNFEYHWGDQLEFVFGIKVSDNDKDPIIVLGSNCITAIGTLLEGFENPEDRLLAKKNFFMTFEEAVEYAIEEVLGEKKKVFEDAIKDNDLQLVKHLIQNGQDVNSQLYTDRISIWYAETLEMVKILIEAGANINAKENYFDTHPIHSEQNLEILNYYLEQGVDPDIRDSLNRSPLDWCNTVERAELLLKAGADIKKTARDTLLHSRSVLKNYKLTKFYLEYGLNINARDNDGKTSLDILDWELNIMKNQSFLEKVDNDIIKDLISTRELLISKGARHSGEDKGMDGKADQ